MLRKLVLLAGFGLSAGGLSGCCLFNCCHNWGCGPGLHGGYGACVVPSGCPDCGTGMYGAHCDPVQRARAVRLERMHRHRYAQARVRRARPYGAAGGYGYGDAWMDDPYWDEMAFDGGFYDMDGYAMGDGLMDDGSMAYGGDLGGGWMASGGSNCQCGNDMSAQFSSDGWVEGPWVEANPQPTPSVSPQPSPVGEPKAMPMDQTVPDPMPVTQDQYYMPGPMPAPAETSVPASGVQNVTGGSPLQPVLWVPGGL